MSVGNIPSISEEACNSQNFHPFFGEKKCHVYILTRRFIPHKSERSSKVKPLREVEMIPLSSCSRPWQAQPNMACVDELAIPMVRSFGLSHLKKRGSCGSQAHLLQKSERCVLNKLFFCSKSGIPNATHNGIQRHGIERVLHQEKNSRLGIPPLQFIALVCK